MSPVRTVAIDEGQSFLANSIDCYGEHFKKPTFIAGASIGARFGLRSGHVGLKRTSETTVGGGFLLH